MMLPSSKKINFFEGQPEKEVIIKVAPSKNERFIEPKVYGKVRMPLADSAYPVEIIYPEKRVELFANQIIYPNHVVLNEQMNIMPSTFMRNRKHHHGGVKYQNDGTYIITKKYEETHEAKLIESPVYHADTDHPDVYGHVLLEVIPSLWAKDLLSEKDLKIATSIKMNKSYAAIFNALNIKLNKVITLSEPCKVKQLLFPTKIVQRRKFIDPITFNIYERLKNQLSCMTDLTCPERIYISRSKVPGRELLNELELEDIFKQKGFTIIHPQELSIYEQVKIFSNAKLIAGVGGSAMHNTVYSAPDAKVLIICSTGWLVVADSLICQQKDQLGYIFGEPTQFPQGGHRTQSTWKVDLDEVKSAISQHFSI
ncbi:glycosyltransferase family 61 protein [Pantoea sp. LMR881]|uniref:glycosyltransferase family 61 protein n=1 Tax=Pantoea sp. LMR881 TaxID=3014336 RepID=UPI0022B00D77|nr:glycosyltransferase family 61 protein [Pantoea sp. LMR881]MCZ4060266.1 glycosyltransferase family 61 protein [Pantoea sp. LMR881]